MPGMDGTGPMGTGPMTGWGRGLCNPYGAVYRPYAGGVPTYGGSAYAYGPGLGWGRGFRARFALGWGRGFGRGFALGRGRGFIRGYGGRRFSPGWW